MGNYNFELNLQERNTMSYIDSYIEKDSKVLEFGAANGRLTKYLSQEKNCHMTIVEIDGVSGNEAAAFAEKAFIGPEVGDINHLVWYKKSDKYNYIIFADVLEHLPDPKHILELCKDMLAKDGRILVSIPNVAHNSILIGLYNDQFKYDEVGLLDKTHIHFFTYQSFAEMIWDLNYMIVDQQAIYSSVGWNEIQTSYADVPHDVEMAFRKRKGGSIYQYVFCLEKRKGRKKGEKTFEDIIGLEQDYLKSEEASCFLYDKSDTEEPATRIGQVYPVKERNKLVFACDAEPAKVRFDAMESQVLLKLHSIVLGGNGKKKECKDTIKHNADAVIGDVMCFYGSDPWIELDVPDGFGTVESITVDFEVVASRFDKHFSELLTSLAEGEYKSSAEDRVAQKLLETQQYNAHLEKDIQAQKEYSARLEKEILDQKKYCAQLEENLMDQKEYSEHLENNIVAQKTYSEHLEGDIEAQKTYIDHLENDIKVLKEHIDKERKRTFWRK